MSWPCCARRLIIGSIALWLIGVSLIGSLFGIWGYGWKLPEQLTKPQFQQGQLTVRGFPIQGVLYDPEKCFQFPYRERSYGVDSQWNLR